MASFVPRLIDSLLAKSIRSTQEIDCKELISVAPMNVNRIEPLGLLLY
jgi:hypothetical protein